MATNICLQVKLYVAIDSRYDYCEKKNHVPIVRNKKTNIMLLIFISSETRTLHDDANKCYHLINKM